MAINVHIVVLVVGLVMAALIFDVGEAGRLYPARLELPSVETSGPDGKANSGVFSVEVVLRNMAQGSVTFQLGSQSVQVQTGQVACLGPVEVNVARPGVQVVVTVKAHDAGSDATASVTLKKVLYVKVSKFNFGADEAKDGRRSVVVTAMESWRLKSGKYLVFQVGSQRKTALSFKL